MRPGLRSPGFLVAVALACAALPAAAVGASSSPARATDNVSTFNDSTGDTTGADIGQTVVSNDNAGMLTFKIGLTNRPALTPDMDVEIYVDTDENQATGNQDFVPGADYVIQLIQGQINLFKWDGTTFSRSFGNPSAVTLSYSYANGPIIKISAAELGNTKHFRFIIFAVSGVVFDPATGVPDFTNTQADSAPDYGSGYYDFQVKVAAPTLVVKRFAQAPAQPVAGKPFALQLTVARSDTGAVLQGGDVTCIGRVGSTPVPAQVHSVVNRVAVCSFRIPKTAKGKTFRGSIAISFEGLKAGRSFSGKIH
jgi:hypothetical protein